MKIVVVADGPAPELEHAIAVVVLAELDGQTAIEAETGFDAVEQVVSAAAAAS